MKEHKITPMQRIKIVMNFYYRRGLNSERVNKVYRNIINKKGAN